MSDNPSTFLQVAAGIALLFGLIGLSGLWRRTLGYVVCAYAALVLAAQHNALLTSLAMRDRLSRESGYVGQSALVFAVTLGVVFVGLRVLFGLAWRPTPAERSSAQGRSGWSRLLSAATCASVGWMLGAVLAVCVMAISEGSGWSLAERGTGYALDILRTTAGIAASLTKPWLVGSLPPVFAT